MKKKFIYIVIVALIAGMTIVLHGCGKDTGFGVGGKVIIKGAGE